MSEKLKKVSPRRRARECTVQALYSWDISKNSPDQIELNFFMDMDELAEFNKVDKPYFRKLFNGTVTNIATVDETMTPYLDRHSEKLDPIEQAILRMAVYELQFELDVPYKVVINEAIEVAKVFGSDDSHKYVNGVLDKVAIALSRN